MDEKKEKVIVFVDLEVHKKPEKIYKIGAIKATLEYTPKYKSIELCEPDKNAEFYYEIDNSTNSYDIEVENTLNELYKFVKKCNADYICGHNIIAFDSKYLEEGKKIKEEKCKYIDTLTISPFLRAEYPYHKLEKGYKYAGLCNDPVKDVKECHKRLKDEIERFLEMRDNNEDKVILDIITSLLKRKDESFQPESQLDYQELWEQENHFFELVGFKVPEEYDGEDDGEDETIINNITEEIMKQYRGEICESARDDVKEYVKKTPRALGYYLANIFVNKKMNESDSGHIRHVSLSPYVERCFMGIDELNRTLRGTKCKDAKCSYCKKMFDADKALKRIFPDKKGFLTINENGKERSLQKEGAELALENKSLFAIFPTGGGKSLTFQLPAIMQWEQMGALTVVISPLQSLMNDQIKECNENNKIGEMVTINGSQTDRERKDSIEMVRSGQASVLEISPEILRSSRIHGLLRDRMIARFVIDEAHCFSSWGQEFRPDYQYIGKLLEKLKKYKGLNSNIPVSCFTATANENVIKDIKEYFEDEKWKYELEDCMTKAQRNNLSYEIRLVKTDSKPTDNKDTIRDKCEEAKKKELLELLKSILNSDKKRLGGSIIVFAAYTKSTEALARAINDEFRAEIAQFFHGDMPKEDKKAVQDSFMEGKCKIMVSTSAFGMGVDKKDVRYVIHYDISQSFEDYVQEAGRAGRDGRCAKCIILYSEGDYDLDTIDNLQSVSKITLRDINIIWNYIRSIKRKEKNVLTSFRVLSSKIRTKKTANKNKDSAENKARAIIQILENTGYLERNDDITRSYCVAKKSKIPKKILDTLDDTDKVWVNCIYDYMNKHRFDPDSVDIISLRNETALLVEKSKKYKKIKSIFENRRKDVRAFKKLLRLLNDKSAVITDSDVRLSLETEKTAVDSVESKIEKIKEEEDGMFEVLQKNSGVLDFSEDKGKYTRKILMIWRYDGYVDKYNSIETLKCRTKNEENVESISKCINKRHIVCEKLWEEVKEKGAFEFNKSDFLNENSEFSSTDLDSALRFFSYMELLDVRDETLVFESSISLTINKDEEFKEDDYSDMTNYYSRKDYQKIILKKFVDIVSGDLEGSAIKMISDYFSCEWSGFLEKYKIEDEKNKSEISKNDLYHYYKGRKLNAKQIKVVDEGVGQNARIHPIVHVTAGPGSGKTTVMVKKVASLIGREGYEPQDILILSHTNATNDEIKSRIVDEIGSDAYRIEIRTFHSFANAVNDVLGMDERSTSKYDCEYFAALAKKLRELKETGTYQENAIYRKKVLILDEAQDLNEYMYEFICGLKSVNYDNEKNYLRIIMVADDNQLIHDFLRNGDMDEKNRASAVNIQNLKETDKKGEKLLKKTDKKGEELELENKIESVGEYYLTVNYRSKKTIVDYSQDFKETFILEKEGRSKNEIKKEHMKSNTKVKGEIHWCVPDPKTPYILKCMAERIAEDIAEKIAKDINEWNHTTPLSIGVLTDKKAYITILAGLIKNAMNKYDIVKPLEEKVKFNIVNGGGNYFFILYLDEFHAIMRRLDEVSSDDGTVTSDILNECLKDFKTKYENSRYRDVAIRFVNEMADESGINIYKLKNRLSLITFDEFVDKYCEQRDSDPVSKPLVEINVVNIHQAKGTEFEWVYMYAPNSNSRFKRNIERMRYVAMTRAKDRLCVFEDDKEKLKKKYGLMIEDIEEITADIQMAYQDYFEITNRDLWLNADWCVGHANDNDPVVRNQLFEEYNMLFKTYYTEEEFIRNNGYFPDTPLEYQAGSCKGCIKEWWAGKTNQSTRHGTFYVEGRQRENVQYYYGPDKKDKVPIKAIFIKDFTYKGASSNFLEFYQHYHKKCMLPDI